MLKVANVPHHCVTLLSEKLVSANVLMQKTNVSGDDMSLKKMVTFRLLLLGVIVIWIAFGAPRLENMLLNGLIVGVVFYAVAAWIDYKIGKRLRDFIVIAFVGVGLTIAVSVVSAPETYTRIVLWASYVLMGYGVAGAFAFAAGSKRHRDQFKRRRTDNE